MTAELLTNGKIQSAERNPFIFHAMADFGIATTVAERHHRNETLGTNQLFISFTPVIVQIDWAMMKQNLKVRDYRSKDRGEREHGFGSVLTGKPGIRNQQIYEQIRVKDEGSLQQTILSVNTSRQLETMLLRRNQDHSTNNVCSGRYRSC